MHNRVAVILTLFIVIFLFNQETFIVSADQDEDIPHNEYDNSFLIVTNLIIPLLSNIEVIHTYTMLSPSKIFKESTE